MTTLRERLQAALAGAYVIERELGRGGMSTVFLAEDVKHKRPVAIKVLAPELARSVGPQRFLREIEIAARLTHPHILPVFDSGEGDGLLYYVMPYVQGESLRQRLVRERRLPVDDAVRIAREIAGALDYAHRRGIVHRDIKPENVLLEEGHAIVADFGVARALAGEGAPALTEVGVAIGTPYYMSPEQSMGEGAIDGRTDLYALGCVLYEMLAGQPVFEGPTAQAVARQHLLETPRRLHVMRPDVPENLERVVIRALAKSPNERFGSGAELSSALASGELPAVPRRPGRRRILVATLGAVTVLVVGLLVARGRSSEALDQNLVVVAPFDVLVPELRLWSEGLVDVLARDLDGAGPMRTVAPTVVVRRWGGRADAPSARALGRRTGAGLAVYGQVLGGGGDSVRLSATLYDVAAGRAVGDLVLRGVSARMDRLADSLTVALLRELGRTRPIGAVRLASLGSTSLPAMKAFLQGEQFYRRTDWDSAVAYYERAIALDSGFALAYYRIGLAYGWQRAGADSTSRAAALKAGKFNHGLAPRESLLVTANSLSALLFGGDTAWWPHTRQLFNTLNEATRRYPTDPEVWYALGDARFHFGATPGIDATRAQALDAFNRAIALDSAFGPSYIHPVDLGLNLEGPDVARRYVRAYLALDPQDVNAQGIQVVARLLDPTTAISPETERLLDTIPMPVLTHVLSDGLDRWPDSAETGIRLLRAHVRRHTSPQDQPMYAGSRRALAGGLAYRGRLRAAAQAGGEVGLPIWLLVDLAAFGIIPPDSVAQVTARWRPTGNLEPLSSLLPWWAARGETGAVRDVGRLVDSVARDPRHPMASGLRWYGPRMIQAYLALARRDSAEALRRFLALPDSMCPGCGFVVRTRATLLVRAGREREAAPLLEREAGPPTNVAFVLWTLERARVNERLGNRDAALSAYRFVADVWVHADPELQPFVAEAKAALLRLGTEPKS